MEIASSFSVTPVAARSISMWIAPALAWVGSATAIWIAPPASMTSTEAILSDVMPFEVFRLSVQKFRSDVDRAGVGLGWVGDRNLDRAAGFDDQHRSDSVGRNAVRGLPVIGPEVPI